MFRRKSSTEYTGAGNKITNGDIITYIHGSIVCRFFVELLLVLSDSKSVTIISGGFKEIVTENQASTLLDEMGAHVDKVELHKKIESMAPESEL